MLSIAKFFLGLALLAELAAGKATSGGQPAGSATEEKQNAQPHCLLQLQHRVALVQQGGMSSPASGEEEALRALDTDGSGRVERREIEAFAQGQGLALADVQDEFKDLDTDGDGELSAEEIASTLAQPEQVAAATATTAVALPTVGVVPAAPVAAAAAPPAQAAPQQQGPIQGSAPQAPQPLAAPQLGASGVANFELNSVSGMSATQIAEAVEEEASRESVRALAQIFAHGAADLLASRAQDAQKAAKVEELARSLRGQTVELQKTAVTVATNAAKEATEAVLRQSLDQVQALTTAAEQATQEAAVRHGKAREAMAQVLQAQAAMRASVTQLDNQGDLAA